MNPMGLAAIVTGGGSGLGAATAARLAAAGARVTIVDISSDAADGVAKRIGGLAIAGDVADPDAMTAAFDRARAAHGPVRVLVNCAGIAAGKRVVGRDGPHPLVDFERVIRVNLVGTFNMMRLAAVDMSAADPLAEGERGVIVSTASVAAFEGQIGQAAYSASKGGVAALTLPVARELAQHGIRVVAIAPGLFMTPMVAVLPDEVKDGLAAAIPHPHRLGRPEEYAELVAHIVDNPYLNGEVIRLDGALRMAPK
jgi:NAD(P)-dependent dehydrogenase (short-subunit alcohol dehydrogenase family)